jgi:pimeloyl-ACP methyl ester carboxylesterase
MRSPFPVSDWALQKKFILFSRISNFPNQMFSGRDLANAVPLRESGGKPRECALTTFRFAGALFRMPGERLLYSLSYWKNGENREPFLCLTLPRTMTMHKSLTLRISRFALASAVLLTALLGTAKAEPSVKNIVLVHGALIDGAGWRGVHDLLVKDGFRVSVVQQPLTSLAEDVAATQRILDLQDGPVVLVGHSHGGTIITVAGADPKVKSLVYVAALQPDAGESTGQLMTTKPAVNDDIQLLKDGYFILAPAKFAAAYAADLPADQAQFMAISQMPVAGAALGAAATVASWHDKPSYGIVATEDKALNPELQRWMYERSKAKVTEIKASHAVFISQPHAVAEVIKAAALAKH